MIEQFGRAGFLLVFAVIFPLIPILASVALGVFKIRPSNPDHIKESIYECGMVPIGDAQVRYNVRYYVFGLLFVVFDVEVVFLYTKAGSFKTRYWTPEVHKAAFALPRFILDLANSAKSR